MKPCKNCETERFHKRTRGYCKRCYPLILKKGIIEKWDLTDKATLRFYPSDGILHNPEALEILKKGYLQQLSSRLMFLKGREKERTEGIDGLTIEYMFRSLARKAGARREVNIGISTWVDQRFTPEQQNDIFRLLHNIEEAIPWSGLSFANAYKDYGKPN